MQAKQSIAPVWTGSALCPSDGDAYTIIFLCPVAHIIMSHEHTAAPALHACRARVLLNKCPIGESHPIRLALLLLCVMQAMQ